MSRQTGHLSNDCLDVWDGAMTRNPVEIVNQFVDEFVAGWPNRDTARLARFFAPDAVYHNVPLDPVHGRTAILETISGFMDMGGAVAVEMVHLLCDGSIVMTERVDHFITAEARIALPVAGIFEVHDGVITAWRDYFDMNQFTSQTKQ